MPHEVRDGTVGEGQGFSEEEESKNNGMPEDLTDRTAARQGETLLNDRLMEQVQQQPPLTPPGPNVRWERFLPVRSLKVLLVEYDDSTRQVVSALLRNCSYEVIAASNGLQAWNVLEDLTNHVDLVLTEVIMPGLSGIGLLSKIMGHKTCKNTPVIMMSSNDSMGIVFKCLSKGAVDFLVKPIRKNELKNLWQHVWRRCHSSSGSGSESGIQNRKSAKSKSLDDSDDNTASTDEDDNGSVGLNARDGSDNGSGTQSSWTKRAVEVESPQPQSPSEQLADPHDSTCALVSHPKYENFCSQWVPMSAQKDVEEQKEPNDDHIMGKDLEIGMPNADAQNISFSTEQISANLTGAVLDGSIQKDPKKDGIGSGLEHGSCKPNRQTAKQDVELLIGTDASDMDMRGRIADARKPLRQYSECENKTNQVPGNMPSVELSLKRPRPNRVIHEDRTILRHSDHSAFTRYNSSAASNQAPEGYGGSSSSRLENCSEAMKTEATYHMISSSKAPLKQGSDGSSNENDVGSTTKNISTKPTTFKDKITITSSVNFIEPRKLDPVQNQASGSQQVTQEKIDDVEANAMVGSPTILKHQVQVQHHHHHYHHYHHHLHSRKQHQEQDRDDLSLQNNAASAPQCGSSNVLGGPKEGIAANFSVNGSASGSNPGSNGQNGSSVAVNTGVMNMDSDNGIGERSGSGGTRNASGSASGNGSGSGSGGNGLVSNRFAQREAALNKFRLKRKERNFGKKVRYQSRKKLAEERPRIRGQFVKQITHENTNREIES